MLEARLSVESSARRAAKEQAAAQAASYEQEMAYFRTLAERAEAAIAQEIARSETLSLSMETKLKRVEEECESHRSTADSADTVIQDLQEQLTRERESGAAIVQSQGKLQAQAQLDATRMAEKEASLKAAHQVVHKQTREIEELERALAEANRKADRAESLALQLTETQSSLKQLGTTHESRLSQIEFRHSAELEELGSKMRNDQEELERRYEKAASDVSYYKTLAEQNDAELSHARKARDAMVMELAHERQSMALQRAHREVHSEETDATADAAEAADMLSKQNELLTSIEGVLG